MLLFSTTSGTHPNKVAVVDTFEAIGDLLGQPLTSIDGLRLFGVHTPRVTGAQTFVAMGIEVNKIRILARRSGDTILPYAAEAPLRSLRADLGLVPRPGPASSSNVSFAADATEQSSKDLNARLRKLETVMKNLEAIAQTQGQDVVGLATGFARTNTRVFVQNTVTAAVHDAEANDDGHIVCGWRYIAAHKRGGWLPYRIAPTLVDVPCPMLCERCLPTEKAIATGCDEVELSGGE